jgi:hypothetical protein
MLTFTEAREGIWCLVKLCSRQWQRAQDYQEPEDRAGQVYVEGYRRTGWRGEGEGTIGGWLVKPGTRAKWHLDVGDPPLAPLSKLTRYGGIPDFKVHH